MSKKYDVTAVTGKYTDANGQEKNRYMNIGVIIETKNGPMLKLEGVPVGWDGWAYLNDPKPREDQPKQQARGNSYADAKGRAPSRQADDFGDENPPF